jgi:hypothetical protein
MRSIASQLGTDDLSTWSDRLKGTHPSLSRELFRHTKPTIPDDPDMWLITDLIEDALIPYERVYNFKLYAALAAGSKFRVKEMPQNVKSLGFVINTEKGKGDHWVAMYIDVVKGTFEYFDPKGNSPSNNTALYDTIMTITSEVEYHYDTTFQPNIYCNQTRLQKGVTQCGVYCIFYIIARLKDHSIQDIVDMRISDFDCKRLRTMLFKVSDEEQIGVPRELIIATAN